VKDCMHSCIVMGCGGHPTHRHLPKKGIHCHHFGQHYEIYSIYKICSTTLQQSTL